MFTPEKAAQVAAFFAQKQRGTINVLKLVKLVYLADRASIARYGMPITFDRLVSMDNGPVPSITLNLINGFVEGADATLWERWITDRENHDVSLRVVNFARSDLTQLSDSDLEIMESVWAKFGRMDQWALVRYTHEHCPEWKDPDGSQFPIHERDIFIALGKSWAEAVSLARRIQQEREIDRLFASL